MKAWYEDDRYQAHPSTDDAFISWLRKRARENELYELARESRLADWLLGAGLMTTGVVLLAVVIAVGS